MTGRATLNRDGKLWASVFTQRPLDRTLPHFIAGASGRVDGSKTMPVAFKESQDPESQSLLPQEHIPEQAPSAQPRHAFRRRHIFLAYAAGILSAVLVDLLLCSRYSFSLISTNGTVDSSAVANLANPDAGSTEVHRFPPASPTNAFPSLFPTNVGYAGPTPTGAEAALVATAPSYPLHTGAPHLVSPLSLDKSNTTDGSTKPTFDIFKHWGNLSPWFSVERGSFGIDAGPEAPESCRVTGLHLLHRHGARYPTEWASYGGPANFSGRLHAAASGWNGSGQLEFMNDW